MNEFLFHQDYLHQGSHQQLLKFFFDRLRRSKSITFLYSDSAFKTEAQIEEVLLRTQDVERDAFFLLRTK
jgi:hypothetical protein